MLAYARTLSPPQAAEYSFCLTRSKIQKFHFCILLASFGNKKEQLNG